MSSTEARDQAAGVPPSPQTASGSRAEGPGRFPTGGQAAATGPRPVRRWLVAGVVVALVVAAAGAVLASGILGSHSSPGAGSPAGYDTGIASVTRQSLTSQTQVNATLGDAGSWNVVVPQSSSSSAPSQGTSAGGDSGSFTWLPAVGRTVYQGQRMYAVSGAPVVLLYGDIPAYRDLSEGMTGADVTELNKALVRLKLAAGSALGPRSGWDYYSAETAYAVGLLQARLGPTETGVLSLGEAVFLPGPALVTGWGTTATLGGAAAPGTVVLTASSTIPVVTIALDPAQRGDVKAGDPVIITLPDGSVTPGVISQVSRAATASAPGTGSSGSGPGSSGATITVLASLTHPTAAGQLNSAPVNVTLTTGRVASALTVPVTALLAQTGGGYAVEVTGPGGHHLVKVAPGLFDDAAGLVAVTGNLTPGQHVVVPGT